MSKKVVLPPKEDTPSQKQSVEESLYKPGKFEVTEEDDFKIEFFIAQVGKRWVVHKDESKGAEKHWVIFRMWNYQEEVDLRKKATNFDDLRRTHSLDEDMLNRLKIQRLLKAWSFQEDNKRLEIKHVNGIITDECFKNIMKLHPTILRFIIECMNGVLERNG